MASTPTKVGTVRLGKSRLKVSKIILGFASYGSTEWGAWLLGKDKAKDHVKACLDLGINTFDTTDAYSNGNSERILGKVVNELEIPREDIVVLTKLYFYVNDTKQTTPGAVPVPPNRSGLSRKHIFASIKASLDRLQMDYVDVLQCHRFDPDTPIEETMQALHDVVNAGYARYIGMSSCYAYQFQLMQQYAINNNLTPFISMQNFYNAAYREEEREMIPTIQHFGVGSIPWSPLARGFLSRPSGVDTARSSSDPNFYKMAEGAGSLVNQRVQEIAQKRNVSMSQVALAWLMSRPGVTAPIIGSTKLENILDLVGAVDLILTEEEISAINQPYITRAISGHT